MAEDDDPKNRVGYKQPPRHAQFKRGQSGNPKGRPKGTKNFATVLEKELRARVLINENGKRKKITKREAIAKQTVNKAASGDPRATSLIFNEARMQEAQAGVGNAPQDEAFLGKEDQLVMESIVRRIRAGEQPADDLPDAAGAEGIVDAPSDGPSEKGEER